MVSPNVRKVSIMLEELELPYAMHHVSVFTGEQFNPAFLTMNPVGKVPVLVDHARGATVFESGAILFYLAETHERFLPASGLARYEVMQWVMVQMASIGPMLGQYNHFSLLPAEDHPYAYARYRTQAERLYRLLDERLRDRKWLAGDDYSIADIATWPWAHYLERHGFAAADHSALLHWRNAIDARPAVGRATVRFAKEFETPSRAAIAHATPADFDRFFARKVDAPPADFSVLKRF
jgi:GST-like protein